MLMKCILPFLVVGFGAVTGATVAARAQAAPRQRLRPRRRSPPTGRPRRRRGAAERVDPANTTNERDKVQIDQFFGDATNATGHLSHGGLLTRSILRNGNPNVPGPAGAVLEYRTQVAKATLLPKSSTPLMSINNQFLFYVVSGEGRLDDGN